MLPDGEDKEVLESIIGRLGMSMPSTGTIKQRGHWRGGKQMTPHELGRMPPPPASSYDADGMQREDRVQVPWTH